MITDRNAYYRERSRRFREQGLCSRCGKRWAMAGSTVCGPCHDAKHRYDIEGGFREFNRVKKLNQRQERREKGLCVRCGKPMTPEETVKYSRCKRCRQVRNEWQQVNRIRARLSGKDGVTDDLHRR